MIDTLFNELEATGKVEVSVEVVVEVTPPKKRAKKDKAEETPKEEKPIYRTYEDFDYEDLLTYAGIDCIVTSGLLAETFPIITEEPKYFESTETGFIETKAPAIISTFDDFLMMTHEYIVDMEINGMGYDVDENARLATRMTQEVNELEDRIFSAMGRRINLDSGLEVSEFLYGTKGFTAPFKTKSGDDAVDGAAILTLAGVDPRANVYTAPDESMQWLCDMAKRRDIASVYRTFIATYVQDWVKSDGRIHPSYNLTGTSGGRISGDSPNLLQLPRTKHGYNIRKCYIPTPGNVFICADFSSAEVKIAAALAKDANMLKAIEEGRDFHSSSAALMMGISYEEFVHYVEDKKHEKHKWAKHWRQVAKILTFSLIYGSTAGGIAMQLGMDKSEAENIMAMYFKAYPGLKKFIENAHAMAARNKFVVTPFGRRKQEFGCFDVFKSTAAYNAALRNSSNVLVQGTCSDMGLITFAHLNTEIKQLGGMSTACVYDSTELDVPLAKAAEAIELTFHYMDEFPVQYFDWLDLPVGCEVEISMSSWGECDTIHRGITQQEVEALLLSKQRS